MTQSPELTATFTEKNTEIDHEEHVPKLSEDTGAISGRQFMFVIISYIQSAILCATFMVKHLDKNDNPWFLQIGSFIMYVPMVAIFYYFIKNYPDKNLMEINQYIFGSILGKIVSTAYLCFYILSASVHLNEVSDFVGKFMLPKMSMVTVAFLVMLIAAGVAVTGVKVFTKMSALIVVFIFLIVVLLFFFSHTFADVKNFLPLTSKHPVEYIKGMSIGGALNYGEIFIFLIMVPKVSRKRERLNKKHVFGGFAIGGLTLIVLSLISIAVLGNMMDYFTFPSFEVMRIVSVWDSVSRFEIVFVVAILLLTLFRIALVIYSVTKGISTVAKIDNYRHLVVVTSALVLAFTLAITKRYLGSISLKSDFSFIPWIIFGVGIPSFTFICSALKLRGKSPLKIELEKEAILKKGGQA